MRRTALLFGTMLTVVLALSGVAWALNTIRCPHDPHDWNYDLGACYGTQWRDEIIGTDRHDYISPGWGNDVVRAGRGPDQISDNTNDSHTGKNVNYGGPGKDRIEGALDSERHYGGYRDDNIADYFPSGNPDYIRCGPGQDEVYYNKGEDRVAPDCEVLNPYDSRPDPP